MFKVHPSVERRQHLDELFQTPLQRFFDSLELNLQRCVPGGLLVQFTCLLFKRGFQRVDDLDVLLAVHQQSLDLVYLGQHLLAVCLAHLLLVLQHGLFQSLDFLHLLLGKLLDKLLLPFLEHPFMLPLGRH